MKPASAHLQPGSYTALVVKYVGKDGKPVVEDPDAGMDFEQMRLSGQLRNAIPEMYNDAEKTNLRVDIKPGDNINLKINIPSG